MGPHGLRLLPGPAGEWTPVGLRHCEDGHRRHAERLCQRPLGLPRGPGLPVHHRCLAEANGAQVPNAAEAPGPALLGLQLLPHLLVRRRFRSPQRLRRHCLRGRRGLPTRCAARRHHLPGGGCRSAGADQGPCGRHWARRCRGGGARAGAGREHHLLRRCSGALRGAGQRRSSGGDRLTAHLEEVRLQLRGPLQGACVDDGSGRGRALPSRLTCVPAVAGGTPA
mmetsp:Transcript_42380/g.122603  ORF Transcript_42380/g.122603 Transcript_42380/m.122603 type:complete len:224 (-) Transcript_42380:2078-2749(-)